jgi:hypothetical protein
VTKKSKKALRKRKQKILKRLENTKEERATPMMDLGPIKMEVMEGKNATGQGGIGMIHKMNQATGLIDEINSKLELFKVHKPYFESDHVMNIAYNLLSGGTCLEDLEVRRNDIAYMDSLNAIRVPDPTTAGDFLRRFDEGKILDLMEINNQNCQKIWRFTNNGKKRKLAILDVDGKLEATYGEFKEGMDLTYKKFWGFSTLILTEMTTGVHLYIVNRSGNTLSQENCKKWIDKAIDLLLENFERVIIRGDSAYYLTKYLDEWSKRVDFIFSVDSFEKYIEKAESIKNKGWNELPRAEKRIEREHGHENVKERVIAERNFEQIKQRTEYVSEYRNTPSNCKKEYRMFVVRQLKEKLIGGLLEGEFYKYFQYITTFENEDAGELLKLIRKRFNHENKIEQLANGVHAFKMPAKEFNANWAYMVIAAMAWNMKCWFGLLMDEINAELSHKLISVEFKRFQNWIINIPCQIIKSGRYVVFKIMSYSLFLEEFIKLTEKLNQKQWIFR